MIFQESPPRLGWWLNLTEKEQIGHRSFGDLDSQLEKFAVNPRRTSERISLCHSVDKITDLRPYLRPSRTYVPGLKLPKQLEPFFVPPNYGLGFYDDQSITPVAPDVGKQNPEETVYTANLRPRYRLFHDGQLLAKYKVFQNKIGGLFKSQKYVQKRFKFHFHHRCILCRLIRKNQ